MAKKPKRCKICGTEYEPRSIGQKVCSPSCALSLVGRDKAKKRKRETREARERIKTRQEWLRDAQTAFNAYIRARDAGKPCISCGRYHQGQIHAGHYRTTKAAPQLRFDERNVHAQCQPCNTHLSGNVVEYRINLIKRIGSDAVEALESDNTIRRWTIEDAKRIRDEYKAKLRAMKND